MERLTVKIEDTVYYIKGKYKPKTLSTDMEPWEVRECMTKLVEYEDTELTPQNIICREDDIKLLQRQNKEFREEILKLRNQRQLDIAELQEISFCLIDMHDECVKWEREAIESKAQLGEIRIMATEELCDK